MYYSSGNYEAFAHPLKPEGVEKKSAYIIGAGLAGLTAAFYMIRDTGIPGEKIHTLERDPRAGGALDGWDYSNLGYTMRGGREMDNHFEVMWDVYRDVPALRSIVAKMPRPRTSSTYPTRDAWKSWICSSSRRKNCRAKP